MMNMIIILVKLRTVSTEHQRQNVLATVNNDKVYKMICTCNLDGDDKHNLTVGVNSDIPV